MRAQLFGNQQCLRETGRISPTIRVDGNENAEVRLQNPEQVL